MSKSTPVPAPVPAGALAGRRALVTGGGRGIGAAIAVALGRAGADVAIGYRQDVESAQAVATSIRVSGRRVEIYSAALDDPTALDAMASSVLADFGSIDILVHSAGIASRGRTVVDTEEAEIERLWRVHALAAFSLCRRILPGMRAAERGDVVMISSAATSMWAPNSAPYNMAKAALEALARTLAKEERNHGIRVNVVAPGLVDTEMGRRLARAVMGAEDIHDLDPTSPFGRVCSPEEVADVVVFLVSTGYVNDQKIVVDAGTF